MSIYYLGNPFLIGLELFGLLALRNAEGGPLGERFECHTHESCIQPNGIFVCTILSGD